MSICKNRSKIQNQSKPMNSIPIIFKHFVQHWNQKESLTQKYTADFVGVSFFILTCICVLSLKAPRRWCIKISHSCQNVESKLSEHFLFTFFTPYALASSTHSRLVRIFRYYLVCRVTKHAGFSTEKPVSWNSINSGKIRMVGLPTCVLSTC